MYIDADFIVRLAAVVSALTIIIGGIIAVYEVFRGNKNQTEEIKQIQAEQRIICEGLKGALQGLIETGCNGPCKSSLQKLEEYLNETAHKQEKRG